MRRRGRRIKKSTIRPSGQESPWGENESLARAMFQLQEVEARGAAAEGLGITDAFHFALDGRVFWSSERLTELHFMAEWADRVPAWVHARWICNQAMRVMHDDLRDGLSDILEAAGRHSPYDQDWAYRQLQLYEHGVLRFCVRRVAGSQLLARADGVEKWCDASMGGFELVDAEMSRLLWRDLSTDDEVATPNIGSAALLRPGEHVIGRLASVANGQLFESRPLAVPQPVAYGVAGEPDRWPDLLAAYRPGAGVGFTRDPRPRESLAADVLPHVWRGLLPALPPEAGSARSVLLGFRALMTGPQRAAAWRSDGWAALVAALVDPVVADELPGVAGPDDRGLLEELACGLAEPAATVCRRLLDRLAAAA